MTLKYKCSTWPTEVLQAYETLFVGVGNGYLSPFRVDFFSSCLICRAEFQKLLLELSYQIDPGTDAVFYVVVQLLLT